MEYADQLVADNAHFSSSARREIQELGDLIDELFASTMQAYTQNDQAAAQKASDLEAAVDDMTAEMSAGHVQRMAAGTCTPEVGSRYLAFVSDAERVSDHIFNLAKTVC